MDLTGYTMEQLQDLRVEVLVAIERLETIANVPAQIEELSARYLRATGQGEPPVQAAERGVGRPDSSQ